MKETLNYNLRKPDSTDYYNVDDFNHNVDEIDKVLNKNETDILNLQDELKISENTKYQTVKGTKEFECKNGYVDNIHIEGETLVNLFRIDDENIYKPGNNDKMYLFNENLKQLYSSGDISINIFYIPNNINVWFEIKKKSENIATKIVHYDPNSNILNISANEFVGTVYVERNKCTDSEFIKLAKSIVVTKGIKQPISYFEGLKSVGQGYNIEVLTRYDNGNLFDLYDYYSKIPSGYATIKDNGIYFNAINFPVSYNTKLTLKPNTTYTISCEGNELVLEYVKDGVWNIVTTLNNVATFTTSEGSFKYKIRTVNNNESIFNIIINEGSDKIPYQPYKYDKKQILFTGRSVPSGVRDIVYKQGDKYYKLENCDEYTFTGSENATWIGSINDIFIQANFKIPKKYDKNAGSFNYYCDRFNPSRSNDGERTMFDTSVDDVVAFIILKSRLQSLDEQGAQKFLKQNPTTIVFTRKDIKITEINNFNPRTFDAKTTFLCNSGTVQCEAKFEVTNSLGSSLDIMSEKFNSLDDTTNYMYRYSLLYHNDIQYESINDVPLRPGRYRIGASDGSFPTTYGNLTIDYGSYTGEFIATFRGMVVGSDIPPMWISINRYGDINDRGWKPWQKVSTTSTLQLLQRQISELEVQAMERGF